jgi:hypothetical protein
MIPILIKKDPNRYENLPYNKEDFQSVIDEVDLSDVLDYIISAIDGDWAPKSYWSIKSKEDDMFFGQLEWIIYSYLVHKKLLMIEDQYFGYNTSRTEKYKDRLTYHNTLERDLYIPIINRMVDEKYLKLIDTSYNYGHNYKLGPVYWRRINLENILNEV